MALNSPPQYGEVQPSGLSKTLGYMGHVNQIVDLLVIIPFVFDGFFRGFVQLRLLRVTRVLRVRCLRFSASSTCCCCPCTHRHICDYDTPMKRRC